MPPSSSDIVAEYAKSKRSTCKRCNNAIAEKELRLSLTRRDPRGFESTKWHHMGCFPAISDSAESIKGFHSVKATDQESLKKLLEDVERKEKTKVKRRIEDVLSETEEIHANKQKLSITSEAKVKVQLSVSDIKDKYKFKIRFERRCCSKGKVDRVADYNQFKGNFYQRREFKMAYGGFSDEGSWWSQARAVN